MQQWVLDGRAADAGREESCRSGGVDGDADALVEEVRFGTVRLDGEVKPTERHWEWAAVRWDQRIPAGGAFTATFAIPLPPDGAGPVQVQVSLKRRAATGYFTGLMSIYLQVEVPPAPTLVMA